MSGRFPVAGKVFEEKYRVEKLLGSGGFARVYLAEQIDLGRMVAIKVLSPKVSRAAAEEETDPQIESVALRFEREARVVSQLRSPQTVTMYDYGRTDSGLLYMVMEYVDGTELDEISVPIEPRRVVKILKQMLQSLHEAHAHGLLHRDLKPANIMIYEHLGEKDQVKLLDFGIAKTVGEAAGENQQDLTADNSLIGTPRYMSPEQIRGADVGPASDIYSLGLVAYELLMGEKAITNSDSIEILGRHLSSESFEIPRHHAIHPALRHLINKMLSKNLEDRYGATKEVLEDIAAIERIDGSLRVGGTPPPTPFDDSKSDDSKSDVYEVLGDEDVEFEADETTSRRRTGLIAAAVLIVLGVAAVPAWKMLGADAEQAVAHDDDNVDDKGAAEALASAQIDTVEASEEQDDEAVVVTLIRTRPKGASVWLGETLAGMAPVQFDSSEHEFPLTVRAKLGERSVEKTLETPGGEIWLDMPALEDVDARAEKKARSHDNAPSRKSAASASKPSTTTTAKAKPEPKREVKAPPRSDDEPKSEAPEDDETRKYLPLE